MCASTIDFGPQVDPLAQTAYEAHTPTGTWSTLSTADKDKWRAAAKAACADAVTLPCNTTSGTWICVSPTGQTTKVDNPGNCGPDDLAQWCDDWDDTNNTCND